MSTAAVKKLAEYDPKREILDKIGDLSEVEVAQNEVLLAIYMRPEKTPGGIILTPNNLKEDRYQGKVGLVLKIGEACRFQRTSEKTGITYGLDIQLHDWVVIRPSDSWTLDINSDPKAMKLEDFVPCRLIHDDQIRLRIENPQIIW